jgi:hypothetical protein
MSIATASRNGDVVWDAKGSEVVSFKAAHGITTYWKGQPLKRKAQSEQGDERPAKKQKKKQKKQHRRFTEPVAYEYDEGVQDYLKALEVEESKALSKSVRPEPEAMDKDIDKEPTHPPNPTTKPPRPQSQPLELTPTAAAALASTSSMLSNRSGAATPPHSSQPTLNDKLLMPPPPPNPLSQKELTDRLLMPPPPRPIPLYRPPPNPTKCKILAWKVDPSHRCLSYLVSAHSSAAPPL